MAPKQTVASFGLQQRPCRGGAKYNYDFLQPWLDPEQVSTRSQEFWIEPTHDTRNTADLLFTYTMSVSTGSFIVNGAFLIDIKTNTRLTEMRAWQLIVDSWLAGGGTQPCGKKGGLKYLVFREVVEPQSCMAMRRELRRQSCQNPGTGQWAKPAEFTPASKSWKKTPFVRCAERVAEALSTASKEIRASRAWIAYKSIDKGEPDFHLVVELAPVAKRVRA
ncbi:hypothetical protein N0V93_008766 [Gnomoniopsis smithogilvyi]|uniref:Uncharacterized protein n=1 Tax=Gnomoniopsis smithogilvyi TaxID=1191159 RepID=A0A9W9CV70_9PEZI|nr:hypothetical protein N0V93_008766 [Gnomoniopsis smithogilvyi]